MLAEERPALGALEGASDDEPDVAEEDVVEEEPDLGLLPEPHTGPVPEPGLGGLHTGGVRTLVPWPVDILDLPDPEEPEPMVMEGVCRQSHGALLRAAQERRRRQQEAGLILNRVVYDAVHFVPAGTDRVPGEALLFESRFESGNLRRAIHVCSNEYDLLLNWDHGTRGHTQWFLFAVRGARQGQTYHFNIINFCKPQSLFRHGMLPLLYSARAAQERGVGWRRGGHDVAYFENGVGRRDKDRGSHRSAPLAARAAPLFAPRAPRPSSRRHHSWEGGPGLGSPHGATLTLTAPVVGRGAAPSLSAGRAMRTTTWCTSPCATRTRTRPTAATSRAAQRVARGPSPPGVRGRRMCGWYAATVYLPHQALRPTPRARAMCGGSCSRARWRVTLARYCG
jgi:hypothetical protein